MRKCGIFTHVQTYPDIIRHIQAYSRIIQTYSRPCVTLAYSESWYIQNQWHIQDPGISKTLAHSELQRSSEPEAYSEPCQASAIEHVGKQLTAIIIFVISAFRVV